MMSYCTKGLYLCTNSTQNLITAHESITTNPKYTSLLCIYGLWPILGCLS